MTKQLLAQLTPTERAVAVSLLGYPEGSIVPLMTPDYIAVRQQCSLQYTLEYIREHGGYALLRNGDARNADARDLCDSHLEQQIQKLKGLPVHRASGPSVLTA